MAENLHAAEMGLERHDQSRAIDLREQHVLNVRKRDQVHHEFVARAIGQGDVNLQIALACHVIGQDVADVDSVEPAQVLLRVLRNAGGISAGCSDGPRSRTSYSRVAVFLLNSVGKILIFCGLLG
jgi:hypothetical protein